MPAEGTQYYGILDPAQEDALHAQRLLQVEERPLQRVTRALISKDSTLRILPTQLPTPPPENEEGGEFPLEAEGLRRQRFREEALLDIAALESSITRIQLIQSSNQRERDRYASEKAKILETAQAVKDNTSGLRTQLADAQNIMRQRKEYDDLATKILEDKKVKSREESRLETEKLDKEIEDLQQESADCDVTWAGRREQFGRIHAEAQAMIRLLKGIKDDTEADKDENEDMEETYDDKADMSQIGTPLPGGRTPLVGLDDDAVIPDRNDEETGSNTPRLKPNNRLLDVEDSTRLTSSASTPMHVPVDIDMTDSAVDDVENAGDQVESMDQS